jgi:hypothetical protein
VKLVVVRHSSVASTAAERSLRGGHRRWIGPSPYVETRRADRGSAKSDDDGVEMTFNTGTSQMISPDGRWAWDGKAWQPIPGPAPAPHTTQEPPWVGQQAPPPYGPAPSYRPLTGAFVPPGLVPPGHPFPAGYAQPVRDEKGMGITGMILSIVGMVLVWLPGLNLLLSTLAIVFSSRTRVRPSRDSSLALLRFLSA